MKLKADGAEMRAINGGEIGLIFQEPMTRLNPLMRISQHFEEAIRLLREADKLVDARVDDGRDRRPGRGEAPPVDRHARRAPERRVRPPVGVDDRRRGRDGRGEVEEETEDGFAAQDAVRYDRASVTDEALFARAPRTLGAPEHQHSQEQRRRVDLGLRRTRPHRRHRAGTQRGGNALRVVEKQIESVAIVAERDELA